MNRIKSYAASLLKIHDEDWKPLLTLQLFIVSICCVIVSLKTISNSLFVSNIGAENLPITYMGCAIALVVSGLILIPFIDKLQRHKVYIITVTLLTIFILFSYVIIRCGHSWIYYFLYIVSYIIDTILFLEFWLIASDLCDTRQAKRVFPLIIGWSLVGGMLGAFGTRVLVQYMKTSNLLLISAAALVSTIIIILIIKAIFPKEIAFNVQGKRKAAGISKMQRIHMDIGILKDTPLLKYICISFILYSSLIYLLDFQFNLAASNHFTHNGVIKTDQLTAFYGMFDGICISVALLFQFFLAQRFLNAIGVANSQLILPSVLTFGFSSIMLTLFGMGGRVPIQPFLSTILTRMGQKVTSSSIYRLSYNLLYNPISKERRGRAKTFTESLVQPIGVFLIGIAILAIKGLSPFVICGISIFFSILYILNSLRLKKAYIQSVLSMFEAKDYSQLESFAGLFGKLGEKEIFKKLYQALDDKDFNIRCFIVDIIGAINNTTAQTPLSKMYENEDNPRVKASIIKVLGKLGGTQAASIIKKSISDSNARIRANTIEALALLNVPQFYSLIPERLNDTDHRVRANAAIIIFQLTMTEHYENAIRTLDTMFKNGSEEEKISSLYAFGEIKKEDYLSYFEEGLHSSEQKIKQRAILSLGNIHCVRSAKILISILRSKTTSTIKDTATQSLMLLGTIGQQHIVEELQNKDVYERKFLIKAVAVSTDKNIKSILKHTAFEEIKTIKQNEFYISAFETMPVKNSVLILIDSLKDQITEAKENIISIIALLGGNTQSIKSIVRNLSHPNRFYRANALEALEQIGEKDILKEIIPIIEEATTMPPPDLDEKKCKKLVAELLKSHYGWIRACAIFSLGKLGALNFTEQIVSMLGDPYELARANAIEALTKFNDASSLTYYKTALNDASPLVRSYAEAALK
ncbi:MAG: HEAT repeat domain-containing protein [Candidatus Ancaeobacter aquaticus]|nr:HEAT repeat domain-containing protein [Candidatus Ancaeobacter aquaticus]